LAAAVCVSPGWCGVFGGTVKDQNGAALPGATVSLSRGDSAPIVATTDSAGAFHFPAVAAGRYAASVASNGQTSRLAAPVDYSDTAELKVCWQVGAAGTLHDCPAAEGTGGERLSSKAVAAIPLNKRDFSQLLLLASGTMTDANGAANFTQQFAVNGQRGTAAVFAMDGIDTTDPELGGATFSNFNVDAIQEIRSDSGVLPASIGHGAAGFTNVITKSGANQVHGSVFEFFRNAALDARNFFDRRTDLDSRRIPPFVRNEFGFTNGGPVVLPHYDGRNRTFYFGQYQGFRQVLGTTQVISVPTLDERAGINTTAYPGDTLYVPVNPAIGAILNRYPQPNDPQGSYGARTYAASSKVDTSTDQFSLRLDHRLSDKGQLFFRFNFNNVGGPITNPSQSVLDPSFAIRFEDHQRNAGFTYTRVFSPHFTSETSLGYERATPGFPTFNQTQTALHFADGLYEPFNGAAGTVTTMFGNLYQIRQNFTWIHGAHTVQAGFEFRWNRDSSYWGYAPNGDYTFSGGSVRSPVEIRSQSGTHDIHVGDPLPDALTGLLTATPFSLNVAVAPPEFAQGQSMGSSAIHRQAYAAYLQDKWNINSRVTLSLGVRYEYNNPPSEAAGRASGVVFLDAAGNRADGGGRQGFMVNLSPFWGRNWSNFAPRAGLDWRLSEHTVFHAGGGIVTLLRSLANDNVVTAGAPFTVQIYGTATPGSPIPFTNPIPPIQVPQAYTMDGQLIFPTGRSTDAAPNTIMDLQRFEEDLAASTADHQIRPLLTYGETLHFPDGYIGTYTAGIEHQVKGMNLAASYVGTAGVHLTTAEAPNGYPGASPEYAPFTQFDASGKIIGGFGPEWVVAPRSHSSFHSLQASAQKTSLSYGLGFQASYTFSKSLDDASSTMGGVFGTGGSTLLQTLPQDPRNWRAEKAPSTFDVTHVFALSLLYALPLDRVSLLQPVGKWFTQGWQLMNVTTLMTGSPFGIYSGVQQTGAGFYNADRPDQVGQPVLSTSRTVREDYFGLGASNASYFNIPINIPGGSGPNSGRFGTLGRNTFRGPGYTNFDIAVIKDTPIERVGTLEFRAEFFNIFNIVNFGLPNNIVLSQGFGVISKTAGTSRQIQFSLKLIY
jgi:hypothetical protein